MLVWDQVLEDDLSVYIMQELNDRNTLFTNVGGL